MLEIRVSKYKKGTFGQEYTIEYIKDGRVLRKTTALQSSTVWLKNSFTKEFEKAKVIKTWLKPKPKATTKTKPKAKPKKK